MPYISAECLPPRVSDENVWMGLRVSEVAGELHSEEARTLAQMVPVIQMMYDVGGDDSLVFSKGLAEVMGVDDDAFGIACTVIEKYKSGGFAKDGQREPFESPIGITIDPTIGYAIREFIVVYWKVRHGEDIQVFSGHSEEAYDLDKPTLVIDQIDGSNAYFSGFNFGFCASVALVVGQETKASFVVDPNTSDDITSAVKGSVVFAEKDNGIFWNGNKLEGELGVVGPFDVPVRGFQRFIHEEAKVTRRLSELWDMLMMDQHTLFESTAQVLNYICAVLGMSRLGVASYGARPMDIAAVTLFVSELKRAGTDIDMVDWRGGEVNPMKMQIGVFIGKRAEVEKALGTIRSHPDYVEIMAGVDEVVGAQTLEVDGRYWLFKNPGHKAAWIESRDAAKGMLGVS